MAEKGMSRRKQALAPYKIKTRTYSLFASSLLGGISVNAGAKEPRAEVQQRAARDPSHTGQRRPGVLAAPSKRKSAFLTSHTLSATH